MTPKSHDLIPVCAYEHTDITFPLNSELTGKRMPNLLANNKSAQLQHTNSIQFPNISFIKSTLLHISKNIHLNNSLQNCFTN